MASSNHLYRRGAAYWFRRRVPADLRGELNRVEWKEALGTRELEEAKRRLRKRAVETDAEIAVARARKAGHALPTLTPDEARSLAQARLSQWLLSDADGRLWDGGRNYDAAERELDKCAHEYREALARGAWTDELETAQDVLRQAARWYPAADPSLRLLAFELLKARVAFLDVLERRQRGRSWKHPSLPGSSQSGTPHGSPAGSPSSNSWPPIAPSAPKPTVRSPPSGSTLTSSVRLGKP